MNYFFRNFLKFTIVIVISLLIGWWAYVRSGSPEYNFELYLLKWYQIPLLSGLIIIGGNIRAWRLSHLFLPSYGQFKLTFKTLFFSISFSFLLGGIGFLIRLLLLKKNIGARNVVSLGFISVEKLFDFLLAFIVFFFLFTVPNTNQNSTVFWINENKNIIFIPFFFFLVWCLFNQKLAFYIILRGIYFLKNLLHIPNRYYYFLKKQIFYLYKSLDCLSLKRIFTFIGHSLVLFVVESCFFYFSLKFAGVKINFSQALLLNSVILIALLVPIFPSGIGLFQAAMVFILEGAGQAHPGVNIFYISLLVHFFLITTHLVILFFGFYQFYDLLKIKKLRKLIVS